MKKKLVIIITIIGIILLLSLYTHYIDSARVRNGVEPKFTLKIISDNGEKITYWGLGYKVIRYTKVSPSEPFKNNKGVKYGSWFMKYTLDEEIIDSLDYDEYKYINKNDKTIKVVE